MPVLVTGADRPLARQLVLRLLEEGGEVRAYASGDVGALRAAGAMVASGAADDEGRLEAALADVHTVVHVGAGVLSVAPEREVAEVETLVAAARGARIARIVALSVPGAHPGAGDALRRAKGVAEARLADAPLPTIVVRVSLLDTPQLREALAVGGLGPAAAETRAALVRVADVLELLVAFDAARSRAAQGHLLVAADGPERVALAALAAPAATRVGRRLLPAARLATLADALTGPWWSGTDEALDGWAFAGLRPAPVAPT
jgi:uncharacterized protein YbjT (DUF2867 family)